MSKLETFKNNLTRLRTERRAAIEHNEWLAAGGGPATLVQPAPVPQLATIDDIMGPPRDLIELYGKEAEVYVRKNLLGDSTLTREQMGCMLHDHLMNTWHAQQAIDSLGAGNRRSYWKPSAKLYREFELQIYLGNKLIGTVC